MARRETMTIGKTAGCVAFALAALYAGAASADGGRGRRPAGEPLAATALPRAAAADRREGRTRARNRINMDFVVDARADELKTGV